MFSEAPRGLQHAPHEVRLSAAGYRVAVREVGFTGVHDKASLMLSLLSGLALTDRFGRNWDALFDVLTDAGRFPERFAVLLCDYAHFRARRPTLAAQFESVLLDAQAENACQGRRLWLLVNEADSRSLG